MIDTFVEGVKIVLSDPTVKTVLLAGLGGFLAGGTYQTLLGSDNPSQDRVLQVTGGVAGGTSGVTALNQEPIMHTLSLAGACASSAFVLGAYTSWGIKKAIEHFITT
jgi:hypothetical protein